MDDDFSVGGGLEDGALRFEPGADLVGVDEVAVVGEGDASFVALDGDGLRVEEGGVSGGGVTGVSDGETAGEAGEDVGGKDVGDEAHGLVAVNVAAVGGSDAGGFLSAMLQGVEAEIGELGGFGMVVDRHHAAFFVQLVENIVVVGHPFAPNIPPSRCATGWGTHILLALLQNFGHQVLGGFCVESLLQRILPTVAERHDRRADDRTAIDTDLELFGSRFADGLGLEAVLYG